MATTTINTWNDDGFRRINAAVKKSERTASRGSQRRRQVPIVGGGGSGSGDGSGDGGTGGSGCCCNELDCLRIANLPDSVTLTPSYYEFTPSTLVCGCVPVADAQATVKLYPTDDPLIWETKHGEDDDPLMCVDLSDAEDECTYTKNWTWNGTVWEATDPDEVDPCDCAPDEPDFDGTEEGQTADTSCDGGTLLVAYWRLTINETLDYFGCDSTKLEFIIG